MRRLCFAVGLLALAGCSDRKSEWVKECSAAVGADRVNLCGCMAERLPDDKLPRSGGKGVAVAFGGGWVTSESDGAVSATAASNDVDNALAACVKAAGAPGVSKP